MQIERRYRKLDWWGLIDHINSALENEDTEQGVYIELLDELRMRTLESVSEGSTYKINTQANKLIENFNSIASRNPNFANSDIQNEVKDLSDFFN